MNCLRFPLAVALSTLLLSSLHAQSVPSGTIADWDTDAATVGIQGGAGDWTAGGDHWYDGASTLQWNNDGTVSARFGGTPGRVRVQGTYEADDILALDDDYEIYLHIVNSDKLTVHGTVIGAPDFTFANKLFFGGGDNWPTLAESLQRGLHFDGGTTLSLASDLYTAFAGSQFVGVHDGTTVLYTGRWLANTGPELPCLMLTNGGRFVVAADAQMDFIIPNNYFTRQLWVHGDGTGVLEFEEGFVADQTNLATVGAGIGAVRLSNTTIITHSSEGIPFGFRNRPDGTLQANGHMVFENEPGSTWSVQSNPQEYFGAIWIHGDFTFDTQEDFSHYGVFESNSDFDARNGLSFVNALTGTKTGPGTLLLAGEHAYKAGSILDILEGTVHFQSNPATAPLFRDQGIPGPTLNVQLAAGTRFIASAETVGIASVSSTGGTVEVHGELELVQSGGFSLDGASTLEVSLGGVHGAQTSGFVTASGAASIGGTLRVYRLSDHEPSIGTSYTILTAGSVSGTFTLDDRTGLGLSVQHQADRVILTTTQEASLDGGSMLIDEAFSSGLSQWEDLSTIPLWDHDNNGSRTNQSAFLPFAGQIFMETAAVNDNAYNDPDGLRTFTALDHLFSQPLSHSGGEYILDLRCRWQSLTSQGEQGRFLVAFNHDYPAGGLDLTPEGQPGSKISDISDPEEAWFARPAYHIRLRSSASSSSMLQYGGGLSNQGEYEIYENAFYGDWWLPTFISGAFGYSPGTGADFPSNSWVQTASGIASTSFRNYRWVVKPDQQELWVDFDDNGYFDDDELEAVMPLPQSSGAPLYTYFETFEGLRLMWTSGQVYVDSVVLTAFDSVQPVADMGGDRSFFARNMTDVDVLLDGTASTDADNAIALYEWFVDGVRVAASSQPRTLVNLPLGDSAITLVVTDETGVRNSASATYSVFADNVPPVADAGSSIVVESNNGQSAPVVLDGSASSDPDGNVVKYTWREGNLLLGTSASPTLPLDFGIGTRTITLEVEDNRGDTSTDTVSITVKLPVVGSPQLVYRENFANEPNAGFDSIYSVGWNLTQPTGDPVPSQDTNGNAHRCVHDSSNLLGLPKVNANPSGTEYDASDTHGYLWMNQMPLQNVQPAEWMGWTDEYPIDRDTVEVVDFAWHSRADRSDSNHDAFTAPTVRIAGQWYIHWDFYITENTSWTKHSVPFSEGGWVLFEPGIGFSANTATPTTLPDGDIEAFGWWHRKSFAWHVNHLDNFEVRVAARSPAYDFAAFQDEEFSPAQLADPTVSGPDVSADTDPHSNVVEYFMALDPNVADGSDLLQPILPGDGTLRLRYRRAKNAPQASGEVRWSTTLEDDWSSVGVEEYLIEDQGDAWLIEAVVPEGAAARKFLHLHVTY